MITQTPTSQPAMTVEEVFDGYDFRTNHGREGVRHYFRGHVNADQIDALYFELYPEHRTEYPYKVDATSILQTWTVFTVHEDNCYLAKDDSEDPFTEEEYLGVLLCTCEAVQLRTHEGTGYEYRHPHPADEGTPGSVPVTWVTIYPA